MGDLSVDALCAQQHVSLTNVYRVRPGEEYEFDDVKINVYAGRHTENAKGVYRPEKFAENVDSLDSITGWYGSLELQNYLITRCRRYAHPCLGRPDYTRSEVPLRRG